MNEKGINSLNKTETKMPKPDRLDSKNRVTPEIKKENAILADRGNGDLAENLNIFETPSGVMIFAATDRGLGKEQNNDRVIINTDSSQFTVLDGMMGSEDAQILADKILANSGNLDIALDQAKQEMLTRRSQAGVCLISAKLTSEKALQVSQIGDCGALVIDDSGKIKFSATDQVKFRHNSLGVDMKQFGIEQTRQDLVSTSPRDHVSAHSGKLHHYKDPQLDDGDTVLLFSDALWSNFSTKEISQFASQNQNPQDLFNKIAGELKRKMSSANNVLGGKKNEIFSSYKEMVKCYYGGEQVPQSDNQSLVIFRV